MVIVIARILPLLAFAGPFSFADHQRLLMVDYLIDSPPSDAGKDARCKSLGKLVKAFRTLLRDRPSQIFVFLAACLRDPAL